MEPGDSLVIVGAGSAGAELAVSARQQGWRGPVTLIGDEAHLPYHRPPLSKAYLSGKADVDSLALRPAETYAKAGIALRRGTRVDRVDRVAKRLHLATGEALDYGKLALCLGARARELEVDGLDPRRPPSNLHCLRSRDHADAIRAGLRPGARLVVIGGGYVGLEVAASARGLGAEVTVLEAQPRVLARVTGPEVSAFYERLHREAGVDLRTGVGVVRIECRTVGAEGRDVARTVVTDDGSRIAADAVLVGVGGVANTELAAAAGLAVDGGIVVDEYARTSDADIYAAGDCTLHPSAIYGRRLRLESVPNALEQARAAAASICGKPKPYDAVPWFWSDQYDLKLQMAGLSAGHDRFVLRGSMAARSFVAFYLRDGRLLAADAVNRPGDFMAAKRLVAARGTVDAEPLGDGSIPLKSLLPS